MAYQYLSNAPLPQGFSVYQPALGAQLQFFPALGSKELDDMMHAFIPGPASIKDKRASVSLDFLEYAQLTGRNFKFYTVSVAVSSPSALVASVSPASTTTTTTTTPSSFSATNNFSPSHYANAAWSFPAQSSLSPSSSPSFSPNSSSSFTASQTRKSSKAVGTSSSPSPASHGRQATVPIDFAHLPGMKIMTKDGLDVTNSASRGSKTKEQRDHAHLMRIIKACDTCKRKKVRCDPSHKKRTALHAQSPKAIAKPAAAPRKARSAVPASVLVEKPASPVAVKAAADRTPPTDDALRIHVSQAPLPFEPAFSFADLDTLDSLVVDADGPLDPWDEFMQYPPLDIDLDSGFDIDGSRSGGSSSDLHNAFLDFEQFASSQSPSSEASLLSDSPHKPLTPLSDSDICLIPGADAGVLQDILETDLPQLPYLDPSRSMASYTDFNLFSPGSSSVLDDELMIPISSHRHLVPAQSPLQSQPQPQVLLGSQNPPGGLGLQSHLGPSGITDEVVLSSDGFGLGALSGSSTPLQSSPGIVDGEQQLPCRDTPFTTSSRGSGSCGSEGHVSRSRALNHNPSPAPRGYLYTNALAPLGTSDVHRGTGLDNVPGQSNFHSRPSSSDSHSRSEVSNVSEAIRQPSSNPGGHSHAPRSTLSWLPSPGDQDHITTADPRQGLAASNGSPIQSLRGVGGIFQDQLEIQTRSAPATFSQVFTLAPASRVGETEERQQQQQQQTSVSAPLSSSPLLRGRARSHAAADASLSSSVNTHITADNPSVRLTNSSSPGGGAFATIFAGASAPAHPSPESTLPISSALSNAPHAQVTFAGRLSRGGVLAGSSERLGRHSQHDQQGQQRPSEGDGQQRQEGASTATANVQHRTPSRPQTCFVETMRPRSRMPMALAAPQQTAAAAGAEPAAGTLTLTQRAPAPLDVLVTAATPILMVLILCAYVVYANRSPSYHTVAVLLGAAAPERAGGFCGSGDVDVAPGKVSKDDALTASTCEGVSEDRSLLAFTSEGDPERPAHMLVPTGGSRLKGLAHALIGGSRSKGFAHALIGGSSSKSLTSSVKWAREGSFVFALAACIWLR